MVSTFYYGYDTEFQCIVQLKDGREFGRLFVPKEDLLRFASRIQSIGRTYATIEQENLEELINALS